MSVSLGPFMTCFVTILILTGYVHFIMKRNSALFRGTIKIVFGVIAVILLRMMVPINFPFTKTIYSSKLLIGLGNIVYANVYGDREISGIRPSSVAVDQCGSDFIDPLLP